MQYNFSNKKYLIRIERLFECQQLRLTQTLCTIENSKQRPRWMTQAKRSQCEWRFNYANNPLIVSIVNLCTLYETQNTFIFFQTTKYITSCSLKHFRDRWGTNCPARTTMTDPLSHMSLRQKYACVQVKMGGGSRCQAVTIYIIKPWVKWLCPCRKHRMLINLCMKVIR